MTLMIDLMLINDSYAKSSRKSKKENEWSLFQAKGEYSLRQTYKFCWSYLQVKETYSREISLRYSWN